MPDRPIDRSADDSSRGKTAQASMRRFAGDEVHFTQFTARRVYSYPPRHGTRPEMWCGRASRQDKIDSLRRQVRCPAAELF